MHTKAIKGERSTEREAGKRKYPKKTLNQFGQLDDVPSNHRPRLEIVFVCVGRTWRMSGTQGTSNFRTIVIWLTANYVKSSVIESMVTKGRKKHDMILTWIL